MLSTSNSAAMVTGKGPLESRGWLPPHTIRNHHEAPKPGGALGSTPTTFSAVGGSGPAPAPRNANPRPTLSQLEEHCQAERLAPTLQDTRPHPVVVANSGGCLPPPHSMKTVAPPWHPFWVSRYFLASVAGASQLSFFASWLSHSYSCTPELACLPWSLLQPL